MLILFDICVSLSLILVMITSVGTNFKVYMLPGYEWFCQVQVVFAIGFIHSSLYTVAVIASERFLLICKQINISDWIWWLILLLNISTTWVLCILTAVKSEFLMMPLGGYCFILWENLLGKICIIVFGTQGVLSILVLIFCYLGIIWTRYKSIRELNSVGSNCSDLTNVQQEIYLTRKKQAKGTLTKSLIQIILYFLCFLPEVLAFFYEIITQRNRPLIWDAISLVAVSCAALNNCIVILVIYPNYRDDLLYFYYLKANNNSKNNRNSADLEKSNNS
ncbi:family A G protein-coupled receptor-like protein [Conidiobolus coronatus NRRL 28638]|uniref:Family A G protein-coupled receptor-like protein n=1 Tax=Conidiobolus coronatus (strain ATCC 28846 / CBS 209.66 / NRRL 28638) TaxID=796925 RepID=A0A137P2A8_CONC2|nr:family A G protein-coupled receptor-like protein [Conidiobolus coronatus NRRL 28638]|eukprot:KXN69014.1 family A G protein-coupled receptor-like protein [Conidiobolus coronatus NRRL 28638]